MESLSYVTKPLAFHLSSQHHETLKNTPLIPRDLIIVIFGLRICFSRASIAKYKTKNIRPAHFPQFCREFQAWAEVQSSTAIASSIVKPENVPLNSPFSRRGIYDDVGTFLQVLTDADGPKLFVKLKGAALGGGGGRASENAGFANEDVDDSNDGGSFGFDGATFSSRKNKRDGWTGPSGSFADASNTTKAGDKADDAGSQEQTERAFGKSQSGDETGTREHEDMHPGFGGMDKKQSEAASKAAEQMTKKVTLPVSPYTSIDLRGKQRAVGDTEMHVPVRRGDYSGVNQTIVKGGTGGYVITGPTGCGKSTVALLPLFAGGSRVMVVEPTQANAANIFHEFTNVLPALYRSRKIFMQVPTVQFIAPTVSKAPFAQLMVTTTDKLVEYFEFTGKLPVCDYLVLDEFHLPVPAMVFCVELLRTFSLVDKYVLVSATAVGFQVNPQLPKAVTEQEGNVPMGFLPAKLQGSDLDPRRWRGRGDGSVAVVVPSVAMAKKLHGIYTGWKLRSFLITRDTTVSDYVKAAANYRPYSVYVIEPAVEAGITLSMSVLISMGCTTAVRFDGKVVVEDTQPLGFIDAIQRGSRGGRIVPTLYIHPPPPKDVAKVSSADYYRAQAVIKMVAAGAVVSGISSRGLFEVFPKLQKLSRDICLSALVNERDPFVAVYKRSANGEIYRECGGTGKGFMELAKKELYLYHYTGGFFVAPVVDLSDCDSKPDEFVVRSAQLTSADAMVEALELQDKYPLDELVSMLIGKFPVYVKDLFSSLKTVFTGDQPQSFALSGNPDTHPEIKHFLHTNSGLLKLFGYMQTEPHGVTYVWNKTKSHGAARSEHSFKHEGATLNFSFPKEFSSNGLLNTDKLAKEVYQLLKGLLAVEILINAAPERCVDLNEYKNRVDDAHSWFKKNVKLT